MAELAAAQFELACSYDRGKGGVRKSYTEAARWYTKAAAGGHCGALNRLAYFYMKGKGVKSSDAQAANCCKYQLQEPTPRSGRVLLSV